MQIKKIVVSKSNALKSIKNSMKNKKEIVLSNSLDACGCTGNGVC